MLDQNEQPEVVDTDRKAAAEPEASPTSRDAIDPEDGLGALVRAVEEAEADKAREDVVGSLDAEDRAVGAEAEDDQDDEVRDGGEAEIEPEPVEAAPESGDAAPDPADPKPAQPVVDDGMNWYVIHTYSGYERKVKQSLEERVRTLGLEDQVAELLIPTEDVVEMKSGRKVVTAKKFFPGYLLIRMDMSEDLWHVVKNTPRVTGFVGSGRKPIPLPQDEVDKIVNRMEESVEAPKPKFQFRKSETVRIIDGPFTNFTGKVEEVDARRSTLKVMVSIFGRNTPVELDFFQVEKV